MNSILTQKASLRSQLKQARSDIPETLRREKNIAIQQRLQSLAEIQQSSSVFCFISSGTEVDTHSIIRQLLAQGKQLAVPKIMGSHSMHAIAFHGWDELDTGQLGILTPRASTPMSATFDATITPGLGFTANGERLGFGRGYYDAWFQAHESGVKIALAYEIQIIEALPTDQHDVKVDMIITEERLIKL